MSCARPVYPGATVLLTRRAHRRFFSFVPKAEVRKIFGYALAATAAKHGILVHAVLVMSNHYHAVVTDPNGCLPDFLRDFHKEVACALNAQYGEWGSVWEAEKTSVVRLLSADDVLDRMVYTLVNPVAACLVATYAEWPGLHSSPWSCDRAPVVFPRPEAYFGKKNRPESLALVIVPPPHFKDRSPARFAALLAARVAEAEAVIGRRVAREGRRILGAAKVLRTPRHTQPASWERRRAVNPTLASRDTKARLQQLEADKLWLAAYEAALARWRKGQRDVVFPPCTWKMVRLHRAACQPLPSQLRPAA